MRLGVGVFAVVRLEAAVHQVELSADPVLLSFEDGEWDRVGVVGLQQLGLLVLQPVAVRGQLGQLVGLGGHEPVEFGVDHAAQGLALGVGDLHALVVLLDEALDRRR
ncbi:MAG: hypothetical protein LKI24_15015 [Acidipropionibacterium sp.]|nr:hypothetical protein [Acidipropionibacterium sp.]